MALIEPQISVKPHKFNHFVGVNYELALNQSIQSLLDSIHKSSSDFSVSSSTFLDLLHARVNPPLETIWFYSALTFRSSDSPKEEFLDRFALAKDLFQSITACSASCSSSKSIALIAPVIYELYRIIIDLKVKGLSSKREKKVLREIKSLVDVILGYINLSCVETANDDDSDGYIRPLADLVSVWIGDGVAENEAGKRGLTLFFPLLDQEIIELLSVAECDVSVLAGAVIAEAFLLRLCLEFCEGMSRQELQNELRTWAVGSITGFQNFLFFEILVKMMLEPTLPVTSLLNSEDANFLRKVLYDAVILVEYSFLNPERAAQLHAKHIKSLAMARLMVTHEAIEFFRKNGDQTKAITYINAFSGSYLPSQLIKLVTTEIGLEGKASGPNGSSPKAFLQWLLDLEGHGMRLLGDGMSKYHSRLALYNIKTEEQIGFKADGKKTDTDLLFYIDNKGKEEEGNEEEDEKMNESISATFVAAAHTMQSAENGGGRKQKERRGVEKKKNVKFLKYDLHDHSGSSGEKSTFFNKDGSSSGSEVEDPLSDEDMEAKEQ